jgi:hypothetical protein
MFLTQFGFKNTKGPLEVRPCLRQVAHGLQQHAQVVEAEGGVGVVGAERFFADGQGALVVRPCSAKGHYLTAVDQLGQFLQILSRSANSGVGQQRQRAAGGTRAKGILARHSAPKSCSRWAAAGRASPHESARCGGRAIEANNENSFCM